MLDFSYKLKKFFTNKALFQDSYIFFADFRRVRDDFKPNKLPNFKKVKTNCENCIVMCAWKRVDNVGVTIREIQAQNLNIDVYIWNNNYYEKNKLEQEINQFDFVKVFHSPKNIGGFGRFYISKTLLNLSYKRVIFLDDDQVLPDQYLSTLISEHKPKSVVTSWGYVIKNKNNYWDRFDPGPGEEVDYAGTRGLVVDINLFKVPEMFECPKKYWFVEDLWLSYVARNQGYNLIRSSTQSITPDDGKDQSQKRLMVYRKNSMLRFLIRKKDFKLINATKV